MRVDPKWLDPSLGDLHVVDGVPYVHLRDANGNLSYIHDPTNGQTRPVFKFVGEPNQPVGVSAAPFVDPPQPTAEELVSALEMDGLATRMYSHWFAVTPEDAAANRTEEGKSIKSEIDYMLSNGYWNEVQEIGSGSLVFFREVDGEGVGNPYRGNGPYSVRMASVRPQYKYVLLGRRQGAIVATDIGRFLVVAILEEKQDAVD